MAETGRLHRDLQIPQTDDPWNLEGELIINSIRVVLIEPRGS